MTEDEVRDFGRLLTGIVGVHTSILALFVELDLVPEDALMRLLESQRDLFDEGDPARIGPEMMIALLEDTDPEEVVPEWLRGVIEGGRTANQDDA